MEKYDVIIIGSGLGGLECAYILSSEGYSVCVLEKNNQIGGNLQTFVRDKRIFDTGVHYIGGLDEGQNLNQFFKYFGIMDKLKLKRMNADGFDRVTFDTDPNEYKYAMGYEAFIEQMATYYPSERKGIIQYCDKIKELCKAFPLYNLREGNAYVLESDILAVNARDYISSVISDQKLANILAGTNPLYAGVGDKTPLYVHALVVNTYIESSWRCIDGGSQIAKHLVNGIRKHGGNILKHKNVKKFVFEGDVIKYVEMADGERMEANYFISNVHPANTMNMIEPGKIRKAYRNRISRLENSISVFSVHIVLEENTFPYLNYNYYHYKTEDVWNTDRYTQENWPLGYMLSTPAHSKSDVWADSMTLMIYMHYNEVKLWEKSFNTVSKEEDRGEDYSRFKADKTEVIIREIEKKFPDIRTKIKSVYSSSPLSYRDYIGTDDGSLYGVAKDYTNPLKSFISPRTRVSNLFLTGQNLNLHGILGVTVGAVVTCSELLGTKYLLKKIKEAV